MNEMQRALIVLCKNDVQNAFLPSRDFTAGQTYTFKEDSLENLWSAENDNGNITTVSIEHDMTQWFDKNFKMIDQYVFSPTETTNIEAAQIYEKTGKSITVVNGEIKDSKEVRFYDQENDIDITHEELHAAYREIDKLASFLLREYPKEIRNESAVDVAIRLLTNYKLDY